MKLITKTILLFLMSFIAITLQNSSSPVSKNEISIERIPLRPNQSHLRDRRAFIKKKKPLGTIQQIFGLFFEQWNDTRFTWNSFNNLINDQFLPENASLTTTTTSAPNVNVSTKPPPFRITRSEFQKILRRNLKGLVRLYNLELNDALKRSKITEMEFRKNVSREVSKFL